MNQKEIRDLIDYIVEKDINEFELERGDVKLRIRRGPVAGPLPIAHVAPVALAAPVAGGAVQAAAAHAGPAPASPARPGAEPEEAGLHNIQSPIVGTFYEAPSPGAPPFIKIGDTVEK